MVALASGGVQIQSFPDFFRTTGPAIATGPEDIVSEITLRTSVLADIMGNSEMVDMLQGGESIRDDILLDERSTYTHYAVNDELDAQNPQVLTQWSIPWRHTVVHLTFTKHEVGLNQGSLRASARFHMFKRLKRAKDQHLSNSYCNGMERDLFAQPDFSAMESASGRLPQSLATTINEFTNGIPTPGGYTAEVQGISRASKSRWRPQRETYAQDPAALSAGEDWDLYSAFSKMYYLLKFEAQAKDPQYGDISMASQILCGIDGITNYEIGARRSQDSFHQQRNNPHFSGLNYAGIPLKYIETLDQVALYSASGGTAFGAESAGKTDPDGNALTAATAQGPRYWWLTNAYIRKYFHADNMMAEEPGQNFTQPFTRVIWYDTWHQNGFRSAQRQGIVYPSATLT